MPSYDRPDLLNGFDPLALCEYLRENGVLSRIEGTVITTDVDASALLNAYTPVVQWDGLPSWFRPHIQHLRDFRTAVRGGQTPTNAQTQHALADVIDALRFINARSTGD